MIMILTSVTSVFAGTYESVLYGNSDGKLKDGTYEASTVSYTHLDVYKRQDRD